TGGARGITAEALLGLAERYRPQLVLVGRRALPDAESPETIRYQEPGQLRALLAAQNRTATPAQIERRLRDLLAARELRRNLERLRAAGAQVDYRSVDVGDGAAFAALIAQIYAQYGRIDGVIHGAGVIEDRLLRDKTPESFARVLAPKVNGALTLAQHLRPEALHFLIFFASVSGRFGNRGQADYAAANEVLSKLALHLDRQWPGRVAALAWGPWRSGMVSPALERAFSERGVSLLEPEVGRQHFVAEIAHGRKGEAELVIAGATEQGSASTQPQQAGLPLIGDLAIQSGPAGVSLKYLLQPARDRYLGDHQLDGRPVLPFAMALELIAETARRGWPDLEVTAVRDMRVFRGITLQAAQAELQISARAATTPPAERVGIDVDVEIRLAGSQLPSYRATVELSDRVPAPPQYQPGDPRRLAPFSPSIDRIYADWLFHGPIFAGIDLIDGINQSEILARIHGATPANCLEAAAGGGWQIDPIAFDSGLQLVIVWSRSIHDQTPLPSRFRSYRRFGPIGPEPLRCHVRFQRAHNGMHYSVDIAFFDDHGRLRGLLEGMECPASRTLNRLAAATRVTREL
ncbi:MAG: SDR family NAD(P)-dependent oxidoreductase, partial [Oscillochloris sp.]|nr:SDR family NAD(P)-dependent oxidoreductase [Oscillochloris sp.]